MKKIIYLLVFALGINTMFSAGTTHNEFDPEEVEVSTNIIHPFQIWDSITDDDDDQREDRNLPDVIMSQIHVLNPEEGILLFRMTKETMKEVQLTLTLPQPVDGVNLTAHWYFEDTDPFGTYNFPSTPINHDFLWYEQQTEGWIILKVSEIDASAATTTGVRTFTASCSGHYVNL